MRITFETVLSAGQPSRKRYLHDDDRCRNGTCRKKKRFDGQDVRIEDAGNDSQVNAGVKWTIGCELFTLGDNVILCGGKHRNLLGTVIGADVCIVSILLSREHFGASQANEVKQLFEVSDHVKALNECYEMYMGEVVRVTEDIVSLHLDAACVNFGAAINEL